jgi:hypothetical protein
MRSSTIGRSPEMPKAHSPDCPSRLRASTPARAMARGGVQNGTGQFHIHLRIGFGGLQLTQHELAVRPGHLEGARGKTGIAVLVDQSQGRLTRVGHAGDDVPVGSGIGLDNDTAPDRDNRIECRAIRAGQRPVVSNAAGASTERPRPMNRARSVS